jgi:hypothetical protein
MTTSAASEGKCARCSGVVTAATTYLTPGGAVCWSCFERFRNEQALTDRAVDLAIKRINVRAQRLSYVHGAMWGTSAILAAHWAPLPAWLATVLIIAIFGLIFALRLLQPWAYGLALGLDAAAALAFLVLPPLLLPFGGGWLAMLGALFPLSLLALARGARASYRVRTPTELDPASSSAPRWLFPALGVVAFGAVCAYVAARRPHQDPARELLRTALPTWETLRARGDDGGTAIAALLDGARPWPTLAGPLEALDRAWPDEPALRDASRSLNRTLTEVGLPYFTDVWRVGEQPLVLTYELAARVPWRVGARTVEVVRLRRLDTLNVEFGLLGSTEHGQPVALLDRIEAELAVDLPAMYGAPARPGGAKLDDFDRLALAKRRAFYEARLGAAVATAAAALGERDRALEEMRSRLHGGQVVLSPPDGLVLGAEWLATLEPLARLGRPGGPLVLDTDLDRVTSDDEKLRDAATTRLFAAAVDLAATATEAHEARHAVDGGDRVAPPPPALFAVMEGSSTSMISMADGELRAFLGEIHDAPAPPCVTLAGVLRNAFGANARATPHFYAAQTLATALDGTPDVAPTTRLSALCALPDADLRARIASAWQKLYAEPMPSATRL